MLIKDKVRETFNQFLKALDSFLASGTESVDSNCRVTEF